MIAFMVIAAPRSGTAWCANWLSTDTTLCLHDPLSRWHYSALDSIASDRMLGVACTALTLFPDFVNRHPARKVILHREPFEVRSSMERLGIGGDFPFKALNRIEGLHCSWRQLFEDPEPIYTHLLGKPFDAERHRELIGLNVQDERAIRAVRQLWRDHASAHA